MQINLYKTVKHSTPLKTIDIMEAYDMFRTKLKSKTEAIQAKFKDGLTTDWADIDKTEYQKIKTETFPAVIFAGAWDRSIAAEDQTVLHSGRMNVDIDMDKPSKLRSFMECVERNEIPYIEAAALSLSGIYNGSMWVNVMIEIPDSMDVVPDLIIKTLGLDKKNYVSKLHTAYYNFFAEILFAGVGIQCGTASDVKRVRYVTHAPNIYVNQNPDQLTLDALCIHFEGKQQKKYKHIEGSVSRDPFEIARKYAENKGKFLIDGGKHDYITSMSICLNRMGIPENDVVFYVENTMGITIGSNCVSGPYKLYASQHGDWSDWERFPTQAPTNTYTDNKPKPHTPSDSFQALGFSKDESGCQRFWFYAFQSNCIISLTPSKMSKPNLYQLADVTWWEMRFPKKTGFDLDAAQNFLISISIEKGFFNTLNFRGRGAWMDNGRVVIHTGKNLIVDGQEYRLGTVDTEFVYEIGREMNLSIDNPLSAREAELLANKISELRWSRGNLDAILLSGWIALTAIGGALNWRPHIWVTGKADSGKSWIVKNILNRMLGDTCLPAEGETTVSGLREFIGNDVLNIVYDEAEGVTEKDQSRLQAILGLMRSSSSSENYTLKGTGSGAKIYITRSMFALASIVVQSESSADQRRVSILELAGKIPDDEFTNFERKYNEFCTKEYVKRFQARMITLMPNILKSIEVFKKAIATKTGSSGLGNQIGTMFAGNWHISNDQVVTQEQAEKAVEKLDIESEQQMETEPDEIRCLQHILSYQLKLETEHGYQTRSVIELIDVAVNGSDSGDPVTAKIANAFLNRNGLKVEQQFFAVANTAQPVLEMFRGTPWARGHKNVLLRVNGSKKKKLVYFQQFLAKPAVLIPITEILS